MKNFEENISSRLKRAKCQSTKARNRKGIQSSFEFKSSLFTEKNKSLIEKLISQSISKENSFSKDEEEKNKKIKPSSSTKTKNRKTVKNRRVYNHPIFKDNNTKKIFTKKIMKKSINCTFSYRNIKPTVDSTKNLITNCKIKPIKKRKAKLSNINPSIEKRKIVFNGITYNGTRNNSFKPKINLNSSAKSLYERKKINGSVKNARPINMRNSLKNKNDINIITVNTINLKNRNNISKVEYKDKIKIISTQKNNNY